MKQIGIVMIIIVFALQCTQRTVVRVEKPATAPEMLLKPVAPVAEDDEVVETFVDGKIDWGCGIIKAKGTGVVDPNNPNKPQARLMAQRAAIVVAQRNLLELIKGVRVTSETYVEDYMAKSDLIHTRVQGVVKGAKQIGEPKYDEEQGVVEVELGVYLYEAKGLCDAIISLSAPLSTEYEDLTPRAKELLQKYSGVVFDASDVGLKPSMFPKIYDEDGNLILDTRTYFEKKTEYGRRFVQYIKNLDKILNNPELKDNPLIIKIKDIRGKLGSDIVISKKDADRYKWLKDIFHFLLKAGRIFVKTL
ncbi:hypothetical protein DRP53_08940 [candidate division WOR-3 bacterium]|uniref:LPP20 lipoprotein n=1 Tax=candidate division WOR-3 bacterium TaxID=2052148 RepID=A0A660SGS1_UNCW3|nr:MAG: hypothetical protein DRP53_08940 [candidate division WOR-3 bacterium]